MSTKTNKKPKRAYYQLDKKPILTDEFDIYGYNSDLNYLNINNNLPTNNKSEIIKSYY